MNRDLALSQLRTFAIAAVAYAGGKGWFTPVDVTFFTAAITQLGPILIPWALSIYANMNVIKVPVASVAAAVHAEEIKVAATPESLAGVAQVAAENNGIH